MESMALIAKSKSTEGKKGGKSEVGKPPFEWCVRTTATREKEIG